jgi:hypothetical protein
MVIPEPTSGLFGILAGVSSGSLLDGSLNMCPSNASRCIAAVLLVLGPGACGSKAVDGSSGGGAGAVLPKRLVIDTTWQELDAEQTRPLTSETDDCYAPGFNLKAVLALLPRDHQDTLRTDKVTTAGTWTFEKDEPLHVTVQPSTDLTKATCSAPVKGWCPGGGSDAPCQLATLPTIQFEATVGWSVSAELPTTFVGALGATPERIAVVSGDRMPAPTGWTSTWVQYSVFVDADGFGVTVDDSGCSPCTGWVQRNAASPPFRSVSTRVKAAGT